MTAALGFPDDPHSEPTIILGYSPTHYMLRGKRCDVFGCRRHRGKFYSTKDLAICPSGHVLAPPVVCRRHRHVTHSICLRCEAVLNHA